MKAYIYFLLAATIGMNAQAEITRTVDDFDGRITVTSQYTSRGIFNSDFYTGIRPWDNVRFIKRGINSEEYILAFYEEFSVNGFYFSFDTSLSLSVNQAPVSAGFRSIDISGIEDHAFSVRNLLPHLSPNASIVLRVTSPGAGLFRDWTVPPALIREWQAVAGVDLMDSSLGNQLLPVAAVGILDHLGVEGWAYDPKKPQEPTQIHVYINNELFGVADADIPRPDLVDIVTNTDKGFSVGWSLPTGLHDIDVYAINKEAGSVHPRIASTNLAIGVINTYEMPEQRITLPIVDIPGVGLYYASMVEQDAGSGLFVIDDLSELDTGQPTAAFSFDTLQLTIPELWLDAEDAVAQQSTISMDIVIDPVNVIFKFSE